MKVIITGMHRSGTSMVAGLLNHCGLYLGKNLLGPKADNPKGFFEDREFLRLNIQLIARNGGKWYKPPARIDIPKDDTLLKMKQFIAKWPKNKLVGWKDPRACLTLRAWTHALKMEDEEFKVILCMRAFDEIVASLQKRNSIQPKDGSFLCFKYMISVTDILKEMRIDWISTSYGNYFKHWKTELKNLTDFLDLKIPRNTAVLRNFIDPGLYHQRGKT